MKKSMITMVLFSIAFVFCGTVLGNEQEYSSPIYTVKFYNRYMKDCGMKNLIFNGKRIMSEHLLYGNIEVDGKTAVIKELLNGKYLTKKSKQKTELSFIKDAALRKEPANIVAKVARTIICTPSEIKVSVTFTAEKKIAFNKYRSYLCYDALSFQVKPLVGYTIEARKGDEQDMSLLEAKYNKNNWGVNGYYNEVKISGEKDKIIVKGGTNCEIRFNYYSDSYFTLQAAYFRNNPNHRELILNPGEKLEFSYSIVFEKD